MSTNTALQSAIESLPHALQKALPKLAVLHDGGNLVVVSHVMRSESVEAAKADMDALIAAGLCEEKEYTYYQVQSALLSHLRLTVSKDERQVAYQHWLAAMNQLLGFLYQQYFEDNVMATKLATSERQNLMAYLAEVAQVPNLVAENAPQVLEMLKRMETLLKKQEAPVEKDNIAQWMTNAEALQGAWSAVRFDLERQNVEQLLQQGSLEPASRAAQALVQQCHEAGSTAYVGANNDLALSNILLARVMKAGGSGEQALTYLQQAQSLLEASVENDKTAGRYLVASLMEQGECLFTQGQLVPAEVSYSRAIEMAESVDDMRGSGIAQTQRASIYSAMSRPADALRGFESALEVFQSLDEVVLTVNVWHQIAMLHRVNGDFGNAKAALESALTILREQGNVPGVISSLLELGSLAESQASFAEAVAFYRQAVNAAETSGDQYRQVVSGNRLADALRQAGDIDEALKVLEQAGNLGQQFGHDAEPWKTWDILSHLESASNNVEGAKVARQRAIEAYVAFRVEGGQNNEGDGQLCAMVLQGIQTEQTGRVSEMLAKLASNESWQSTENKTLLGVLGQLLAGERNLALIDNAELNYRHAAELMILQDRLPDAA
ncbi:MAG: tetratricopeptide repeat protein [Leucothrix sp.]